MENRSGFLAVESTGIVEMAGKRPRPGPTRVIARRAKGVPVRLTPIGS